MPTFAGGVRDRNATLWSSFHLRGGRHSFFFAADTGLTAEYSEIAARLGPFDVTALEAGAYHPDWGDIHMGPENALRAHALLRTGAFLPIHWGTFNLAMHPWDEPVETILRLAPAHNVRLLTPRLGEPLEPSRADGADPWWRTVAALHHRSPQPVTAVATQGKFQWPGD